MKTFARVSISCSAQTGKSVSAGSNPDRAVAGSSRATGIPSAETYNTVPGKPGTDMSLDRAELKQIAETWGVQFADSLITDTRWPSCNQAAAVVAAGAIVKFAIDGIARILGGSELFAPHTAMMSATMHNVFWNSMPSSSKKGKSDAPTS